ncbi:hypothetical protein RNI54_004426 [Pseudomonas putida]|nr:hypothetical protein [Pseudomonas putida]
MEISLVDNGLDSLTKGYEHLSKYEQLLNEGSSDKIRFLQLKDSVLSIQHGIEILFKYILKCENELFIYKDISALGPAFIARRENKISELWEQPKVQTISFKDSIERLEEMCGVVFETKFRKRLLQVEGWRNSIIHSAIILNEQQVSSELQNLMHSLDELFGHRMGREYIEAQGKVDLERAYRLAGLADAGPKNEIKRKAIEGLIAALKANSIKVSGAPSVFKVDKPDQAFSILESIQNNGIVFGCDLINGHCSGKASVTSMDNNGFVSIYTDDNKCVYTFKLSSIVVYIPKLDDEFSPLIYIYADRSPTIGKLPYQMSDADYTLQRGLISSDGNTTWEKPEITEFWNDWETSDALIPEKEDIFRFLSKGPVCFMNIQQLEYGRAQTILHSKPFRDPEFLYNSFRETLKKQ